MVTHMHMVGAGLTGYGPGTGPTQGPTSACVSDLHDCMLFHIWQEPGIRSAELAWIGVLAALVACLLSALGGVYSEKLLKKDGQMHSIHLQNMLLYSWGILFNGFALVTRDGARVYQMGLMHGYSGVVWVMLTNNAFNGLASTRAPIAPASEAPAKRQRSASETPAKRQRNASEAPAQR